jgi:hypothetical protein
MNINIHMTCYTWLDSPYDATDDRNKKKNEI